MTSGTWDRHRGHSAGYDVLGLGFNYRMDEPRAALLLARLEGLEDDIARRRRLVHRYRRMLADVPGVTVPYRDDEVDTSSCYVMPVMLDDAEVREPLRAQLLEQRVQTSVLYPAIHEFTAFEGSFGGVLPRAELAARTELTLPLYPTLTEGDQDHVVEVLRESLAALEQSAHSPDRAAPVSANPLPAVDVVVPAFNEEGHVDRCLDAIFAQDYPSDRYRVWVVDAGSTDYTAAGRARARGPGPPARARERGGAAERGPGLQPGDPAGQLPADRPRGRPHLPVSRLPAPRRRAAEGGGPAVCCVGAQPEQVGETPFGEAVALARGSSFGVGASVYADERTRADVDTIQAGVYRRAPVEEVGGFRTDMLVGEDEELNWRLKKAGYSLVLDTSVRFVYTTRSSWGAVFRQHRNYGQSRVRVLAAHPDFLRPYHLAPPGMVAGAGLGLAAPFSRRARRPCSALAMAYGAGASAAPSRRAARGPT